MVALADLVARRAALPSPNLVRSVPLQAVKAMDDVVYDLDLWERLGAVATAIAVPLFTDLYYGGVEFAERAVARLQTARGSRALGDDPDFDAQAAMYVVTRANAWWQQLSGTTRPRLLNIIIEARDAGHPVDWVIEQIEARRLFGSARALKIGVTETTRLFGAGAQATYRHLQVPMWDWRTVEDNRVDPTCDALADGSPYPIEQDFFPAHVMCRCWPSPRMETTR